MRTIFVGTDGEQAYDARKTADQIRSVKSYWCGLEDADGQKVTWEMLEDPDSRLPLFARILEDRRQRTIGCSCPASRPNFCAITVQDGDAVRLEYYEGHERLQLVNDLRSSELRDMELGRFLEDDPVATKAECFRNVYIRYKRRW